METQYIQIIIVKLLLLKLECKVLDPCSFATDFPPHPNTLQVTTEHRWKITSTVGRVSFLEWANLCFKFWLFSYQLCELGNSWKFLRVSFLICNIHELSLKGVRAGLIFSFLRWGIEAWQGYTLARQPPCRWRPAPGPNPVHSQCYLTPLLLISCSNWNISNQPAFLKPAV